MIAFLEETRIPKEALLVTIDVSSLYINTPQDEGTSACLEATAASQATDLLPDILQMLFDIVLKCNIFHFENSIISKTAQMQETDHADEDGSPLHQLLHGQV